MGLYINPPASMNLTKEQWLEKHAVPLASPPESIDPNDPDAIICLVDNTIFTAAGVVVDNRELASFVNPHDYRPKKWYMVEKTDLTEVV